MFDFLFYRENEPLIFTQSLFWYFFGVVIVIYQFIYPRIAWRNFFLTLVSLYFYYLSGGYFFVLLVISTLIDYYIGKWLHESENPQKRKWLLVASMVSNLGILAYFKYTYFFTDTFNTLFQTQLQAQNILAMWANTLSNAQFDIHKIILPVGISFYTFQTMSYSIDIYRRQLEPVKNIWDFAFFVSFFPQLVAGPIVRASEFVPQIYLPYRLSPNEFGKAIFLIMNGLVKKIFISDYISINFVDRIFENPAEYSGFEILMGVYGYAIQIYCDFSGYSDMAIGIALLLGFRLNLNFSSPYKALNITDFWRRWHISLSSWLRDYLYISMGGNRKGKFKTYLFLLITMLLGGLWHGAHVRFIIWGGLHGAALALHKLWLANFPDRNPTFLGKVWAMFLTFHFVCFCWIFFRAGNMEIVNLILSRLIFEFNVALIPDILWANKAIFSVIALGYFFHHLSGDWKFKMEETFIQLPDLTKAILIVFLLLLLFQVRTAEVQPFIYFQF